MFSIVTAEKKIPWYRYILYHFNHCTEEYEIKALINCIWCGNKATSFINHLLNHLLSELDHFYTSHNYCPLY